MHIRRPNRLCLADTISGLTYGGGLSGTARLYVGCLLDRLVPWFTPPRAACPWPTRRRCDRPINSFAERITHASHQCPAARVPARRDARRTRGSQSPTISVKAFVKENFERAPSDIPCEFDEAADTFTCFGRGNAGRFGPITSVVVLHRGLDHPHHHTARRLHDSPWPRSTASGGTPGQVGRGPGDIPFVRQSSSRRAGRATVVGGTGGLTGADGLRHDRAGPRREHDPDLVRRHDHPAVTGTTADSWIGRPGTPLSGRPPRLGPSQG